MSILTSSTINTASSTRIRHTQNKSAPLTSKQKKEKAAKHLENQTAIDEAVDEWFSSTTAKANELAERFNKKPRYFLDLFFHGGARMVHHQEKINPHNAFMSLKAQELRDEGHGVSLLSIQREYKEEYDALCEEERGELIKEFKENVDNTKRIPRPSPRGRILDFSNTVRNIIMLVDGLKTRVGIEGFFCLVRNTPTYHMNPQWYFTSEALANYMKIAAKKWNTHDVGTKIEAFAIAGCDAVNLLTTSKRKADYLKAEIRNNINMMLTDITGNPKAVMHYARYDQEIVQRYGIKIQGWTYEKFMNPSELSSSLPPLKALHDALVAGTCKFVKLTAAEKKEHEAAYMAKIASGDIELRKRKRRSDVGVRKKSKRARKESSRNGADNEEDDDDDDSDEEDALRAPKSIETIEDSDAA